MRADRIFAAKLLPDRYIVLCNDGEYRPTSPSLTHLGGAIQKDYVPLRLGYSVTDITETPDGQVLLSALNSSLRRTTPLIAAARMMGQKGGKVKSAVKTAACRLNGKKGGRPRKKKFDL